METQPVQGFLRQDQMAVLEPPKYCLYARKSTEQEEKQILSIDSQIKEMLQIAQRDGLNIVEMRRESHSAKASGQRPVFNELVTDIRSGKFNAILTWAPDRLSRNAGDLGSLVDLMDQKLLFEIRTFSQKFSNNPNEKFLLMILCSQAKLENDNKSVNVKRGMRARVEMGLWPGVAPTGYLNNRNVDMKCHLLVDPQRAPILKKMFERVAYENQSGRQLYPWLKNEINFKTRFGSPLSLSNIYLILKNTFYYGQFEYPVGSGRWYTGKHAPIITKELYDKVQEKLIRANVVKSTTKEFAFTKMIVCGACGSGITAQEKFKQLKNGTTNRYVYYGCSRSKDNNCKLQYIREEELINQLLGVIDQVDINELGMKYQLEQEVERYRKFQSGVLRIKTNIKSDTKITDIRVYAKYLLKEGSIIEKREILSCLKSKLVLKDRVISLKSDSIN
jgi:DNA invertase Pin-like site-specific DNA recombinase